MEESDLLPGLQFGFLKGNSPLVPLLNLGIETSIGNILKEFLTDRIGEFLNEIVSFRIID